MQTSMYREVMDQCWTISRTIESFTTRAEELWSEMGGRQLFLIGTGASYNACAAAQAGFVIHRNVFPQLLYAAQALRFPVEAFSDAVVIIASQSGESWETKQLCRRLRGKVGLLTGLTMDAGSTLGQCSDEIMTVDIGSEVSSATKTYTAQALMLMMLAGCKVDAGLQADMSMSLRAMDGLSADLVKRIASGRYGYIAGIGALTPVAAQAALLFKEKCFLCYEGMSVNELRHGTIEAVSEGMNIILMCTGAQGLKEAELHIECLKRIGADVTLVHDAQGTRLLPDTCQIQLACHVEETLAALPFAAFAQVLCERIARESGYDVDGFRHLSKIVGAY